jgi:hypothetical protein
MCNNNAKYERIKLGMLENIWKMVHESGLLFGLEIWGVDGEWELVFWVQGISCKKMLRILEAWPVWQLRVSLAHMGHFINNAQGGITAEWMMQSQ